MFISSDSCHEKMLLESINEYSFNLDTDSEQPFSSDNGKPF